MTRPDSILVQLLIVRCQLGDDVACTELVSRYQLRLHQYLKQFVRDNNTVNDLYQDIWFDVFRSISKLKDIEAFASWLFRIAHDRVCRLFRRRGIVYGIDSPGEIIDSTSEEQEAAWDTDEVTLALDRLIPNHREVLVLRYLHEFDYAEIATILNCPLGTVRSRLFHAKQALRIILEMEQDHERESSQTSLA